MFKISRRIEIDAGHRIPDHASKCKSVHGHRYVIEAICDGALGYGQEKGMVMDFGFLKGIMVEEIDRWCDHALILQASDPILFNLFTTTSKPQEIMDSWARAEGDTRWCFRTECVTGKLYVMGDPPTAECLAMHWHSRMFDHVMEQSGKRARLQRVRVWETPNCVAEYPA